MEGDKVSREVGKEVTDEELSDGDDNGQVADMMMPAAPLGDLASFMPGTFPPMSPFSMPWLYNPFLMYPPQLRQPYAGSAPQAQQVPNGTWMSSGAEGDKVISKPQAASDDSGTTKDDHHNVKAGSAEPFAASSNAPDKLQELSGILSHFLETVKSATVPHSMPPPSTPKPAEDVRSKAASTSAVSNPASAPSDSSSSGSNDLKKVAGLLAQLAKSLASSANGAGLPEQASATRLSAVPSTSTASAATEQSFEWEDDQDDEDDDNDDEDFEPRRKPSRGKKAMFEPNPEPFLQKKPRGRPSKARKALEAAKLAVFNESKKRKSATSAAGPSSASGPVCAVCLIRFPDMALDGCNHMLCQPCILELMQGNRQFCPHCRASFSSFSKKHF